MAISIGDRFLIALAKFFGESPLRDKPLASVQLSPAELMDEILSSILIGEKIDLTLEKFNRLMISCRHRLSTEHFFQYFFKNVRTVDDFEAAVDRYRIKAMWLFGNFRFAYRSLATSAKEEFFQIIQPTERVPEETFAKREPFNEIQAIRKESLHLLGYIAKRGLDELELTHAFLGTLLEPQTDRSKIVLGLGPERLKRILGVLKKHNLQPSIENFEKLSHEEIKSLMQGVSSVLAPLRQSLLNAVTIGFQNTDRYLTLPYLDVYVATSMREEKDFIDQHDFTLAVFSHPLVKSLNLRYFDPTLSYVENRITKGLIEMLMLRRAAVTIYVAGASDTLGKDSELAATLAQGKAVIVYVPEGEQHDRRAQTFREDHPLGLQIAVGTGVAHGIIVVRTLDQCAKMLRKVMLRERAFNIEHEKGIFLLREVETNSVVRVVSDDPLLAHAFWTYFNQQT